MPRMNPVDFDGQEVGPPLPAPADLKSDQSRVVVVGIDVQDACVEMEMTIDGVGLTPGWRWDPDCGWMCLRCSRPIDPPSGTEGCCCPEPLSLEQRREIMDALTTSNKGGTDR